MENFNTEVSAVNQEEANKEEYDYNASGLEALNNDIHSSNGDPEKMKSVNKRLNEVFLGRFGAHIDDPENEEVIASLRNSVAELLSAHKDEPNFKEDYKSFIAFADALHVNLDQGGEGEKPIEKTTIEKPKELKFEGEITGIEKPTEEQREHRNFYSKIDKKPEGAEEGAKSDLEKCEDRVNEYIESIDKFLNNDGLDADIKTNLGDIKTNLENISNVIGNPDIPNTSKLQDFIWKNLDEESKKQFQIDNHYREKRGFDGQFGVKTLEGLNKVMDKIGGYINDVDKYLKDIEDNKKNEAIDKLTNAERNFQKGGNPEDFLKSLGLPEGSVDFCDDEQKDKLNKDGKQEIKLKVNIGGEEKEVTVVVNLVSGDIDEQGKGSVEEEEKEPEDKTPFEYGGNKYLVMANSPKLARNVNIPGAAFYYKEPFTGEPPAEGIEWQTKGVPEGDDYPCILVFNDKFGQQNIYEITVDQGGNICPVAKNFKSGGDVVFENLASGVNYLYNKLPDIYRDNPNVRIGWSDKDYYIGFKGENKYLTIEPMTIDGYWLKDGEEKVDLTDSLAFLMFTNFLRNSSKIDDIEFYGDDPDLKLEGDNLYVRVDKKKNGNKRRYNINRASFGLPKDNGVLKRFIRYNNHEDWNDNWDAKKPNRYYTSVKLS